MTNRATWFADRYLNKKPAEHHNWKNKFLIKDRPLNWLNSNSVRGTVANVGLDLKVYKLFSLQSDSQSYSNNLTSHNYNLSMWCYFSSKTVKSKTVKPRLTDFTVCSFFQDSKQPCLSCKIDIYNGLTNLKSAFFFAFFSRHGLKTCDLQ